MRSPARRGGISARPILTLSGSIDRVNLQRAVEQLPPGYKSVFVLHDVQGYEHNEIAEIMGCSIGNSKSQLHKARMRLRDLLQEAVRAKAREDRRAAGGAAGGRGLKMATMGCNEFLKQLETWMEGERSAEARAHVRECAGCRGAGRGYGRDRAERARLGQLRSWRLPSAFGFRCARSSSRKGPDPRRGCGRLRPRAGGSEARLA